MPVPRGAHAVVLGGRRARALPLLRLREGRRRHQVRHGDRAAGLPRGGGAAGRGQSAWSSSASARTPRRSSAASGASGCWRCWSAPPGSTPRSSRDAAEAATGARLPARAGPVRGGAARLPRGLRAEGLGPAAHRRAPAGLHRGRAAGRRPVHPRPQRRACYDRFRERITFPLADARGRVLGFGARAMRDEQGAKYINTAEGEIYHKGRQLFGIDRARAAVAKAPARDRGRGLHRRAGPARRRHARDRGRHGHRPDQGPDRRAGPAGGHRGHGLPGAGRRPLGPGGHAAGGPPGRGPGGVAAGGTAARGQGPGRPGHGRGAGGDGRLGHQGPLCA